MKATTKKEVIVSHLTIELETSDEVKGFMDIVDALKNGCLNEEGQRNLGTMLENLIKNQGESTDKHCPSQKHRVKPTTYKVKGIIPTIEAVNCVARGLQKFGHIVNNESALNEAVRDLTGMLYDEQTGELQNNKSVVLLSTHSSDEASMFAKYLNECSCVWSVYVEKA